MPPRSRVGRGIRLRERLEQFRRDLRRDADSGVADLEQHLVVGRGLPFLRYRDAHPSAIGELDRVAHEIGQDLPQPDRIAAHHGAQLLIEAVFEADALALGIALHQTHHRTGELAQIEGGGLQTELFRLDLRIIEDVVHDPQQLTAPIRGRSGHIPADPV